MLDPNVVVRADAAALALSKERAAQGAPQLLGPETRGREYIANMFRGRATTARPASVDGNPGLVVPIGGRLIAVFEFTIEDGAITEIALTSDTKAIDAMALEY